LRNNLEKIEQFTSDNTTSLADTDVGLTSNLLENYLGKEDIGYSEFTRENICAKDDFAWSRTI